MGSGQKRRKLIWSLVLLLALCCSACTRQPGAALPRVAQGHVQWLEKQSMLGVTHALTSQVSASERLWQNISGPRTDLLLDTAPNWFVISPHLVTADSGHFFSALATSPLLDALSASGVCGLFLSPTGERSDVWTATGTSGPISPRGENVCSLRFDAQLGTDKEFAQLAKRLDERHIHLGGGLIPAATGLGPDFMLQARNVTRYEGLYAMLNVPREYWDNLPVCDGEWDCRPLDAAQQQYLATNDIVPKQFMRDSQTWASPGGWAITGEVRGVDGNARRWVYRYAHTVLRPIMLWQDPSGLARRVASAAIIRHTGLQRQVLAGVSMEPLLGLETGAHDTALAPALNAIEQVGLEIHRYGGWSLQMDAVPPGMWSKLLTGSMDFCADHGTELASFAALEAGNAAPLAAHLADTIVQRIPHKRLARGLTRDMDNAEPSTLAGRVAHILHQRHVQNDVDSLREAVLLLVGIRAGLPGLCFVTLGDFTGATTLAPGPLWDGKQTNCLFGSLAEQWHDGKSVANQIVALLQKRQQYRLASASLERVEHIAGGGIALVNALPQGGHWITVANFGDKKLSGKLSLPKGDVTAPDFFGGRVMPVSGQQLEIRLMPREVRHMVFAKR